jgi:hypothetical protein
VGTENDRWLAFSLLMKKMYWWLLIVRCLLAFSPGYIHLDEFFQSPEITAGN